MRTRISRILATPIVSLALVVPSLAEQMPLSDVSRLRSIEAGKHPAGHPLRRVRANRDGVAETVSTDAIDYMGFSPDRADTGRLLASGHLGQGGSMGVILSTDGGVTSPKATAARWTSTPW